MSQFKRYVSFKIVFNVPRNHNVDGIIITNFYRRAPGPPQNSLTQYRRSGLPNLLFKRCLHFRGVRGFDLKYATHYKLSWTSYNAMSTKYKLDMLEYKLLEHKYISRGDYSGCMETTSIWRRNI